MSFNSSACYSESMRNWIIQFKNSSRETKWYILNWVLYGFLMIATTIYCYARLDFVRSYKTSTESSSKKY